MSVVKFIFSKVFVKQLLLAVVAIIVFAYLILTWLKFSTNHNEQIKVPDLAKLTFEEAQKTLEEFELRLEILDSANYNPDYPQFSVIDQVPEAGSNVKENRKIYITLNPSGYRKVEIPPLVGRTRRQAEPTLRALGFEIGEITYQPYIAPDEVLEMRNEGRKIQAGEELPITSVIDLVLGDGKERYQNSNSEESEEPEKEITENDAE
ncbi:PASTA domain-containing protein [uncultured Planktosalinus sp.]|uniref:PASTA domain-containing protein n=1 Tax=uncultured Planktosalinus sp. TaxID=1810935 RepID=UPI0030D6D98E